MYHFCKIKRQVTNCRVQTFTGSSTIIQFIEISKQVLFLEMKMTYNYVN